MTSVTIENIKSVLLILFSFYAIIVFYNDDDDSTFSVRRLLSDPKSVDVKARQKDFLKIALKYGTDKVLGVERLQKGLLSAPDAINPMCRGGHHMYHTMYQNRLGSYSIDGSDPFQFLEIGFFHGKGYETYREFLSDTAEAHSMEISCAPDFSGDNYAVGNKNMDKYVNEHRLHCGDASNLDYLHTIWQTEMRRPNSPPLKVVVDDGSHDPTHMVTSMLFWFPRIEPGGLLIMEDIVPARATNLFRTQFLPQIMSDVHFCGAPGEVDHATGPCFPTLQKFLKRIDCEMHICVFERNGTPAEPDFPLEKSVLPDNALDAMKCPVIASKN